jgi:hypothetical protein
VEGQCDNPLNKALTLIAMIHVSFQPLVLNYYFMAGQVSSGGGGRGWPGALGAWQQWVAAQQR